MYFIDYKNILATILAATLLCRFADGFEHCGLPVGLPLSPYVQCARALSPNVRGMYAGSVLDGLQLLALDYCWLQLPGWAAR